MLYQEVDSGEMLCYRKFEAQTNPKNAKNIILIHGNFCGQRNWDPFIKYLREFNVYTVDLRGFGKSTYNKQLESLFDFSKDLISFCDKQGLKKVQLVGWSLGGAVVMSTALLAPTLVESLILMSSVNLQGFPFVTKAGRLTDVELVKQRISKFAGLLAEKNRQFTFDALIDNKILPRKNKCGEGFLEVIYEQIESQRNYSDATAQLGVWDISDRFHQIQCPILIYHGTDDVVIPFENAIFNYESFKKVNPKTFICKLQGGTHAPVYEVPEQMSQLYSEFINNHTATQMVVKL